jgi:hypothetical protein
MSPPVGISLLQKIAESIKAFLGDRDKNKLARNDRFKNAWLAVLIASSETRTYLADMIWKKQLKPHAELRLPTFRPMPLSLYSNSMAYGH